MRSSIVYCLSAIAVCLWSGTTASAGSPDASKYPLRVYIFRYAVQPDRSRSTKHTFELPDYVNGMGQADLFESGEPRGFQFSYSCTVPMRESGGHQTFPARWKGKQRVLEILLPEKGKPENLDACELQPDWIAGQAFIWKNGAIAMEPSAQLKDWMAKHRFDPENSDQEPIQTAAEPEANDPLLAP